MDLITLFGAIASAVTIFSAGVSVGYYFGKSNKKDRPKP